MITLEAFDNERLVIVKSTGSIDKASLISFMEFLYERVDRQKVEKALMDFRDTELNFTVEDLKEILQQRIRLSVGFSHRLVSVYMVQEAKETAFTTIYSRDIPHDVAKTHVCSTVGHAIKLLNLSLTVEEVEERIRNLSVTFNG